MTRFSAVRGPRSTFLVQMTATLVLFVSVIAFGSFPAGAAQTRIKAPSAPTAVQAASANTALNVSWQPPASNGGASIIGYSVTAAPSTQSCTTSTTLGCTVTGLINGHKYHVKVRASNTARTGRASTAITAIPSATPNCSDLAPWANLQGCDLERANLAGLDLSNANLTGAMLIGAVMTETNLSDAVLTGANLNGADLDGADLDGVTWSATTCPDGISSDLVGDTCANDLSDQITQANLNAVLSSANTMYSSAGGSYATVTPASLEADNPSLTFTTSYSTGPTSISVKASTDRQGLILAAFSQTHTSTCWYIYDDQGWVTGTADPPWGSLPTGTVDQLVVLYNNTQIVVPTPVGVYYAEVKNDVRQSDCNASNPQSTVGLADYYYELAGFPEL